MDVTHPNEINVCPECEKCKTVEHNAGQWCPDCGKFVVPPNPDVVARLKAESAVRTARMNRENTAARDTASKRGEVGYEIELQEEHEKLCFPSLEALRTGILGGKVPRTALVRTLGAGDSKPVVLESWAKSHEKLRELYAPVWSTTLKGALWGTYAVGALKILDTLATLFRVNPLVAILWALMGAFFASPKWKKQIAIAAAVILLTNKNSINFSALPHVVASLCGAWFGVIVFAVVFGASSGMSVGTVVGAVRARGIPTAPDKQDEGTKPWVWGLAIPLACFAAAVILYLKVFVPFVLKNL